MFVTSDAGKCDIREAVQGHEVEIQPQQGYEPDWSVALVLVCEQDNMHFKWPPGG